MMLTYMHPHVALQVHIFPEGTRSRDPSHLGPIRQGIGRLVAASAGASGVTPLIVPFVHVGMHEVLPVGSVLPSVGKQVGCC
jgi:monolysocardiolipin acyltransferase